MNFQLSKLSLERVPGSPPLLREPELQALSSTYAEVFAGEPWNEWTRCPDEDVFFGKETNPGDSCSSCNVPLAPAYPLQETMEYIHKELQRPEAAAWILFGRAPERAMSGFSWGFAYQSPEEFAAEKYRTAEMQERVGRALRLQGVTGGFYYLSESGIVDRPDLRGQGISREFHTRRLERAAELGLPAVQRTLSTGPMYRTSQRSGMIQVMGPEAIVDTAARRITPTGRVINDIADSELANRVLFVKQP
jgi:GNAT superfamily N-acetyltransferase